MDEEGGGDASASGNSKSDCVYMPPKLNVANGKVRMTKFRAHKIIKNRKTLSKYERKILKRLKNLRRQISKYKKWTDKVRLSLKVTRKFMGTTKLVKVVENLSYILKVKENKHIGSKTYTLQQKTVALLVMRKSVTAYKFMCNLFFLPPVKTLLSLLKLSPQQKVKTFTMANLEAKAQKLIEKVSLHCMLLNAANKRKEANMLKKADLYCLVLFREYNLKIHMNSNLKTDYQASVNKKGNNAKHADHCLIFMIRGLWEDLYKLPAAYIFYNGQATTEELAAMIKQEIMRLQKAMFIPVATICNEEGHNQSALKYLVAETRAAFEAKFELLEENVFYVNGKKVVPVYDTPQLMMSIRNHLLKYDLMYERNGVMQTAKWKHVEDIYKYFLNKDYDPIAKLSRECVYPRGNAARKPEVALRTFSHKVASYMAFTSGIAHKNLPKEGNQGPKLLNKECVETAHLLKFFDDLFDSVNGSKKQSKYDEHKPLLKKVKLKSIHRRAWADSLQILKTMKFINKAGKPVKVATIDNWIWTIEGYKSLMKYLFFNTVIDGIWMRWVNQDPLNTIFKDYCDDRFLDYKKYCGH